MSAQPLSRQERHSQRQEERRRAEARRSAAQRRNRLLAAAGGVALVVVVAFVVTTAVRRGAPSPSLAPEGTQDVAVAGRAHVQTAVDYPTTPAAGGPHAPVWQNCGYYAEPVLKEMAVHSLEHGAVWLAYDPALPAAGRATLQQLTGLSPGPTRYGRVGGGARS